jgi:soluble lytic murein transglycosylase-like protein
MSPDTPKFGFSFPKVFFALVVLSLLSGAASTARADYAVLRSGTRLHITGYEVNGDRVRLAVSGGTVEIAANDLLAVEPEELFRTLPKTAAPLDVRYASLIHAAAAKHGVDERLVAEIIAAESNFNSRAISRKRALGLMQLLPETAARYAVRDVFNPEQNIDGGVHYLKDLLARYKNNVALALAAYNAGPERVDQYGRRVPPYLETMKYVQRIAKSYAKIKAETTALKQAG